MNPILKREFFVRWRDWRSHLLLLGLAMLLSAAAYWSYSNAINTTPIDYRIYPPRPVMESLATRASRTGHALFSTLAIGNVAIWFIMAPLLTATGVARERERGLLESLQLSRMSARSQVFSRAVSAMLYLLALQLMTLPVYFVAFSFGGVSPGEIGRAWIVVASAAWCGVGLGLMLSSSAGRPSGALFSAVALLCGWSLAAYLGMSEAFNPWGFLSLGPPSTKSLAQAMYWSHPVIVITNLCEPTIVRPSSYFGVRVTGTLWPLSRMLPICSLAWLCVGAIGLAKARRDVTRAFAPAGWAGRNPIIESLKRNRQQRIEAERQRASAKVGGALLADLPFDRLIRFKNPLLNREVKSRFRLRRASTPLWIGRAGVFLFAVVGWTIAITMVFDGVGRPGGALVVMWMEWVLGVALVGTFAASSFAREREAGTWEGVRLSLLSNGQIARTKWASPLVAFALLTFPLWLLLFAFAPIGDWSGVPFRVLLSGGLAVAASLSFVSALAVWISLRARNTTTATCWTLGTLLALFCIAPVAWGGLGMDAWSARQILGVSPPVTFLYNSNDSGWREQNEVRDRYTLETGLTAPIRQYNIYGNSDYGGATSSEVEQYWAWCDAKQKASVRIAALSGAWNPALVLDKMGQPRTDSPIDANTLVQISLVHVLFCSVAIALLLGAVTLRLNVRSE
ncbi:hypothetical protein IAD21_01504 [Abditibacteriota bacterium]|nr:hypothetical protein IAD21_01504 [Abditibacteriota bacterium]